MHNPELGPDSTERAQRRVRLARLEADLAYFLARLEIIGDPESANQMAQRKVFKLLHQTVAGRILTAKRQYSESL